MRISYWSSDVCSSDLAYRQHNYAEALRQFEASAQWGHHGGWALAAAHYWAARARLAAGEMQGVSHHLETAAPRPLTFYGQLPEAQLRAEQRRVGKGCGRPCKFWGSLEH